MLAAASKAYAVDTAPLTRVREASKDAHATLAKLLDLAILDVDAREEAGA